jgi:hypothetical protein
MRAGVDRALVAHLLLDQSLSYREVARRANCSDWSVRSIAAQLDDEGGAIAAETATLSGKEWCAFLGITALVLVGFSYIAWRTR